MAGFEVTFNGRFCGDPRGLTRLNSTIRSIANPRSAFILLAPSARRRVSSQRFQHPLFLDALRSPLKKSIFRSNSAIRPSGQSGVPSPEKTLPGPCRNSRSQRRKTLGLASNARAASPIETPCSRRRMAANLNPLMKCLRVRTLTHFPFDGF